jgi:hypothetical protein
VDGYSSPQEKELIVQVSKARDVMECKGLGWEGYYYCVNIAVYDL